MPDKGTTKKLTQIEGWETQSATLAKETKAFVASTVAKARELKNITELCSTCEARWKKEKGLPAETTTGGGEEKSNN